MVEATHILPHLKAALLVHVMSGRCQVRAKDFATAQHGRLFYRDKFSVPSHHFKLQNRTNKFNAFI
jgi:hypothetical protein